MNSKLPGLLWSMNCSDGGSVETSRRFHAASAACIQPARKPTRGSGVGAVVVILSPDPAHAAASAAIVRDTDTDGRSGKDERGVTGTPFEGFLAARGSLRIEPREFPLLVHVPLVFLVDVDADLGRIVAAHGPPLELLEEAL